MRGRYIQAQPTVFGMVTPGRIRWRHHRTERRLHAAWQEAARLARTPIIYTATDENLPLTYGVPEVPAPVNYDALAQYAFQHRLDYNELCRVVRDARGVSRIDVGQQ